MRSLTTIGMLIFALNFCGLGDRIKQLTGSANTPANSTQTSPAQPGQDLKPPPAEKAVLTPEQRSVADAASEAAWDDQGMIWRLPSGWKKTEMKKETALFSSPDGAFLIPTISTLRDEFPLDIALIGAFNSAQMQARNGKYEMVRVVEIDGIPGVETVEAMPEDKGDPRRHQWIGYRRYNGQTQQVNIILSTKGSNFDKHKSDFPAILYSMKIGK
ncbi:MAG: hypothetical protein AB7Q37_16220 [Pyrinomonadaceae bacterium]